MTIMKSRSICIIGPTSAGKTSVAIEVAKHLGGEVIGLDSRQIYHHMTIGTAQPAVEEQQEIPHHLYGIRKPDQPISAGEYSHLIEEKIEEIKSRGNLPIICGGSGLYFRALTKGIFEDSTTDLKV
ncbi:MAG: tRNA delta(2)-isopentenylpyrophosphate transferase, partial [Candidatus Scalindua rubra]